jgi:tellurite resistance protein TerC
MLHVTFAGWAVTLGAIASLLALDWFTLGRRPHEMRLGEAARWSVFYVLVSMLFGVAFSLVSGWDLGAQYFTGYVVELSLSVDNLFVFVIILGSFAVPVGDNTLVTLARRMFPMSSRYDGSKILTRERGRRVLTPLFLALLAIGSTDLLFAFDSIPAVFGVTDHAYIVFAANAFALLGLRPLFFLVSGLLDRLVYMSTGLAIVLGFIGVKLILEFAHHEDDRVPEISTAASLAVIVIVLSITTVASVNKSRRDTAVRAHAGSLRRRPHVTEDEDD